MRNKVSLIGNLGADPKITTLESGTVITELRLATNEYYRDRDGNRQTRTMWHTVKAFNQVAKIIGQYATSGSMLAIDGRLSYRDWTDKHDQKRTSTEIIVDDFTFLSSRDTGNTGTTYATVSEGAGQRVSDVAPAAVAVAATATTEPAAKSATERAAKSTKSAEAKSSKSAKAKAPAKAKQRSGKQAPVAVLIEDDELPF